MELHSNVHRRSISTNAMPLSVSLFLFSLPFPFSLSLSLLVTLRLDTRSSMKFFVGSFPRDIFDSLLLLLYPSPPLVVVIKTNEKRRKEKRNPFRLTLARKQEENFTNDTEDGKEMDLRRGSFDFRNRCNYRCRADSGCLDKPTRSSR